jgi:hypothetical protein
VHAISIRALFFSGSREADCMHVYVDYQGKRIRLTEERLAHILDHPEMTGMEPRIAETLAQPAKVVESLSDEQARLYYRFYLGTRIGDKHLCVVVKDVDADDAFVVTAYLTDKVKKGRVLWPREN